MRNEFTSDGWEGAGGKGVFLYNCRSGHCGRFPSRLAFNNARLRLSLSALSLRAAINATYESNLRGVQDALIKDLENEVGSGGGRYGGDLSTSGYLSGQ